MTVNGIVFLRICFLGANILVGEGHFLVEYSFHISAGEGEKISWRPDTYQNKTKKTKKHLGRVGYGQSEEGNKCVGKNKRIWATALGGFTGKYKELAPQPIHYRLARAPNRVYRCLSWAPKNLHR